MFLNIDQIKSRLKLKDKKHKGNLLLEVVIAFAIVSILSVCIWSIMSTNLRIRNENNKILNKIQSLKIIIKELEVNTSYDEIIKKNKNGEINISEIENIKAVKGYIDEEIYNNLKLKINQKNKKQIEILLPSVEKNELRISKYKW